MLEFIHFVDICYCQAELPKSTSVRLSAFGAPSLLICFQLCDYFTPEELESAAAKTVTTPFSPSLPSAYSSAAVLSVTYQLTYSWSTSIQPPGSCLRCYSCSSAFSHPYTDQYSGFNFVCSSHLSLDVLVQAPIGNCLVVLRRLC